uniref:NADH dehydrogenase subunit 4 n=1 Tax=Meliboeus sinae TaxID=2946727 RepID=UPI00207A1448|nr:NADH dehydrogenase subunit 4 [Meliboeus sinae]URN73097.1 NADH dehydrogenase subunit 4 [Meliboeus sinae]
MVKFVFYMIFMIPSIFIKNGFWVNQFLYFFLSFVFLLSFGYNWSLISVSGFMGVDLASSCLVLLSFWVSSLMILASFKILKFNYYVEIFLLTVLILNFSLFMVFSSLNLFVFYLFFEISLIPVLVLILGWGYQPERLQAGFYLLFYTIFASLPMLISIFFLYDEFDSFEFIFMNLNLDNSFLYLCLNLVFFVKMPMYFVHLWLPKAHVEAPVSGSMVLAGVMLKLGGYGLIRLLKLFQSMSLSFSSMLICISMVGGSLVSLICLRQTDIKSLIAYSSVAHMGLVLGGLMTLSYWGFGGALCMMISHGLSSSGLFCLANIGYERLNSRSLFLNKGFLSLMPSISLWWFMFSACNMSAPPSLNLLSEIILINSLINWSLLNIIFISMISFLSACYSLYLYSYSQHGKIGGGMYSFSLGSVREHLLLFLHWFPLNILVLKGDFMTMFM